MFTLAKLEQILLSSSQSFQFCIAYSGGQDSHTLLHAMAQLRDKNRDFKVRAIHVHHGLSPHADQWVQHCQQICEQLAIPLSVQKIKLNILPGDSIEAVARKARYEIFATHLQENENLLTAHTLNDQAETFLLQLLRGAGVKGLSAMPLKKSLGKGFLLRPLLECSRDDLTHYAEQNHLRWIEDETNVELRFNRNFLRHQVLPILQQRWPEALLTISRSAKHCAEAAELLDEVATADLVMQEKKLNIEKLLTLPVARQRNALRHWIRSHHVMVPNAKHIEEIFSKVIGAEVSAMPVFAWENVEIRRYQNYLYLLPALASIDTSLIISWDLHKPLELPHGLGKLMMQSALGEGIQSLIDRSKITVRFRQNFCFTPQNDGCCIIRFSVRIKKDSMPGNVFAKWLQTKLINFQNVRMVLRNFQEDRDIWENKIYRSTPVLCDGDGPILHYRRWAQQYYSDIGPMDPTKLIEPHR